MRGSGVLLAALAIIPQAICQGSLSSTSAVTCITTLGSTSVLPVPTTSNLRSLTVNSLQSSTFTPTVTSIPPDTTTTLTYTVFPSTTTTLPNPEIDTFFTTTTFVSAFLTTDTVTTTITSTVSQTTTNYPTSTVPTAAGFTPAASAQASVLSSNVLIREDYPKRKRSFDRGSLEQGSSSDVISARQASDPAANSSSSFIPSPSAYVYPAAVSCIGVVEYFSVSTRVVSTAPIFTTTQVPHTDTTSTTETTTITDSALSTPASTTSTVSTTITTTSLAGTSTSTVYRTSTTTVTVQAAQATTYAACQANNLVTQVKDANYPINNIENLQTLIALGTVKVYTASSAYACCVQVITGGKGVSAFLANTGQCYIFACLPKNTPPGYSYCSSSGGNRYTLSSGCEYPAPVSQCAS